MTLEELYEQAGGNYDEILKRLGSESFIGRFVVRFLDDTSCAEFQKAWADGDEKAAFEAAHAAKGVCANLALTDLASVASQLTEALRPGNDELRASTDIDALAAQFEETYKSTVAAIQKYQETQA